MVCWVGGYSQKWQYVLLVFIHSHIIYNVLFITYYLLPFMKSGLHRRTYNISYVKLFISHEITDKKAVILIMICSPGIKRIDFIATGKKRTREHRT